MSGVPEEVVVDILSRLPVKPLLRFRCVSKAWLALIDTPHFINLHLNHSIQTNSNRTIFLTALKLCSIDLDTLNNAVELNHPLKCDETITEILGSCHGLLCLHNSEKDIALWNPSTRNHRNLPVTDIQFPNPKGSLCFLVEPIYSFGYDLVNDDYKVVRIVQFYGEHHDLLGSEVKVYSLKSNSWRRITDFPYYVICTREYDKLAGGALHWVVSEKNGSDGAYLIAAFDLGTEEYRLVPQPDYSENDFLMNLEVLGGCLSVLCNYYSRKVDIWVMKSYGVKESWTKLVSIAQPNDIGSFQVLRAVAYSKSGEELLMEQDNKVLIWYDLKRKTLKKVKVCSLPNYFEADVCLGSLVQISHGDSGSHGKKHMAQEKGKKNARTRRQTN